MNHKLATVIFVSSFALVIISSIAGSILESKGLLTADNIGPDGAIAIMIFYFCCFLIISFSLVPLVLRLFIYMQIKIGNSEFFLIKWFNEHERALVYGFWGLMLLGLAIIFSIVEPSELFR